KRMALVTGSLLAVMQGDFEASIAHGERAIQLGEAAGEERPGLEVASALGRALLTVGEEERALALFRDAAERGPASGRRARAAEELRTELGAHLAGVELAQRERALSFHAASLAPEALAAAFDVGRKLSLEDAAALVGQTGSIRPVSTS